VQQPQRLGAKQVVEPGDPDVAARPVEAGDVPLPDRVATKLEHNRGAGDSQHRLNIDLANVFAAWTDTISLVKRPALGIERTVRSFGTLEALRSFSYLSCHSKVISLTFYDQRVPSWSELKLGVLRTQQ
jgi:hypothetical protein